MLKKGHLGRDCGTEGGILEGAAQKTLQVAERRDNDGKKRTFGIRRGFLGSAEHIEL